MPKFAQTEHADLGAVLWRLKYGTCLPSARNKSNEYGAAREELIICSVDLEDVFWTSLDHDRGILVVLCYHEMLRVTVLKTSSLLGSRDGMVDSFAFWHHHKSASRESSTLKEMLKNCGPIACSSKLQLIQQTLH